MDIWQLNKLNDTIPFIFLYFFLNYYFNYYQGALGVLHGTTVEFDRFAPPLAPELSNDSFLNILFQKASHV